MELTDARKALLMVYCRLDEADLTDDEKLLLEEFYFAAVDYLADAGVAVPTERGRLAKFDLVINSMVLALWDHRDLTVLDTVAENPVVRRFINQLKLTEPVSNSDTGLEKSGEEAAE